MKDLDADKKFDKIDKILKRKNILKKRSAQLFRHHFKESFRVKKSDLKLIDKVESPLLSPDFEFGPSLFKTLSNGISKEPTSPIQKSNN